jgi:NADH-quinone oxidoreductase subunit A
MQSYTSLYLYFGLIAIITFGVAFVSLLFPSQKTTVEKFLPYESGNITQTNLLQERFPLRHYLVALIFLVFDVEVIFMYPWAVIAKEIGPFAFYEMLFFLIVSGVGFAYVWRKKGLGWE